MAGAGLDGDLREADRAVGAGVELAAVAVEIGLELVRGGVLLADLADLAADADGHAVGLERADEGGQLGRAHVVLVLLLVERGERQVDQRGAVDVDVPVAGGDRVAAGLADLVGHLLGIGRVLLGVELVVVALDEDRALPAGGDGAREDAGGVLEDALEGVGLLGASQLEDDGGAVVLLGRLEDDAGHVERLGAKVDGRDGHPLVLAAERAL